jgi:hypothetical protein
MNNLLIFFALPVATIILAVVFERLWKCYKLVTATIFAIYLIVTFAVFDESFLIYAFIYTLLAYVASYISMALRRVSERLSENTFNACNENAINANVIDENSIEIQAGFDRTRERRNCCRRR